MRGGGKNLVARGGGALGLTPQLSTAEAAPAKGVLLRVAEGENGRSVRPRPRPRPPSTWRFSLLSRVMHARELGAVHGGCVSAAALSWAGERRGGLLGGAGGGPTPKEAQITRLITWQGTPPQGSPLAHPGPPLAQSSRRPTSGPGQRDDRNYPISVSTISTMGSRRSPSRAMPAKEKSLAQPGTGTMCNGGLPHGQVLAVPAVQQISRCRSQPRLRWCVTYMPALAEDSGGDSMHWNTTPMARIPRGY